MSKRNPRIYPKDKNKITTLEMELILMQYFKFDKKIIVPNVRYGITYNNIALSDCDLLSITSSNYGVMVEIKISKPDLLKDKNKKHDHNLNNPLIKTFYFAVPYYLEEIALEEIPDYAGLLVVTECGTVYEKKKPINDKNAIKWSEELKYKLCHLGTMRIFNLKKNILKLRNK